MTLSGLLYALGQIGINDKLVNYAAAGSSIYALNDVTQRDYPCFFASPTGTHRVSENYVTYQVTLFVFDRLLEDNSNDIDVQSTSVETLKNLIKKIPYLEGVAGISDEYTIQVFVETEKFKDRTTGAYATIEIMLLNESTCIMPDEGEPTESGDTPTENWYLYFNNPDGETIPAESTAYTVEWRTNIPDIPYIIYGPEGVIESGSTDGEIRKEVVFAENESTATTREYTFMFLKDNGDNLSGLTWYQDVKAVEPGPEPPQPEPEPDYYFNFTVPDNQVIPADATGFTVSWRTNMPEVAYTLATSEGASGGRIQSGTTEMYITFPANNSIASYKNFQFIVYGSDYSEINSLSWKQEKAEGYFEFITQDGARISSAATTYTVEWDTNYYGLTYELSNEEEGIVSSGNAGNSGQTFTFPASNIDSDLRYEVTIFYGAQMLGTLTWVQERNSEIPHNYSNDYLSFNILTGGTILWEHSLPGDFNVPATISYSLDDGATWSAITSTDEGVGIQVQAGDKVLFKGTEVRYVYAQFKSDSTLAFDVEGNAMSLLYGDDFKDKTEHRIQGLTFNNMFRRNEGLIHAHNLILPATLVGTADYQEMFYRCSNLETAPELPAATLWANAYYGMFSGCTKIDRIECLATTMLGMDSTTHWLANVSPTGTFIKKAGVDWTTGENGIPDGWTVQEI